MHDLQVALADARLSHQRLHALVIDRPTLRRRRHDRRLARGKFSGGHTRVQTGRWLYVLRHLYSGARPQAIVQAQARANHTTLHTTDDALLVAAAHGRRMHLLCHALTCNCKLLAAERHLGRRVRRLTLHIVTLTCHLFSDKIVLTLHKKGTGFT